MTLRNAIANGMIVEESFFHESWICMSLSSGRTKSFWNPAFIKTKKISDDCSVYVPYRFQKVVSYILHRIATKTGEFLLF